MGKKYSTQTTSGYDSSPPSDDGSKTEANKVKWSTIKTKLTDPEKTRSDSMDSALVDHFDEGPIQKSTTYTTVATDYAKTIECSGTFTLSLLDASTGGAGYKVKVKNNGSGTITVDTDTGTDKIDGETSVTLAAKESMTFVVNASANGYYREDYLPSDFNASTSTTITTPLSTDTVVVFASDGTLRGLMSRNDFTRSSVQRVEATPYTTYASSSSTIGADDTIPQSSEGTPLCTAVITPISTSNRLAFFGGGMFANAGSTYITLALFENGVADALAAITVLIGSVVVPVYIYHEEEAGGVAERTFILKVGTSSGTMYINGNSSSRLFGGKSAIRLYVGEFK